jgi:hypothetical protein
MPRRRIVPAVQIAAKLMPFLRNPHFIMPNVPPIAPSIVGKHGPRSQSQHQQNSRNHPFHIFILLRTLRILPNANPAPSTELRSMH